jgi:uncharacterized protein
MMQIFDFNIHLPVKGLKSVDEVIADDLQLDEASLIQGLYQNKAYLERTEGSNILLFNMNLFSNPISNFLKASKDLNNINLTSLIDFRRNDILPYIDVLISNGVKAVMVNSYLQQIADKDISLVLNVFKYCESKGLIISIDGSYGTSKMLDYNNLKLMCSVAEHIKNTPIVIIHSGGLRVKEVMLLALENPNVYLDTSFSLPFYLNSSLEQDFAFAYKKIGTERVFFGSDLPYVEPSESINQHLRFFEKFHFSSTDIEKIFCHNAMAFFNQ